jgi:hypothetical protein
MQQVNLNSPTCLFAIDGASFYLEAKYYSIYIRGLTRWSAPTNAGDGDGSLHRADFEGHGVVDGEGFFLDVGLGVFDFDVDAEVAVTYSYIFVNINAGVEYLF